MTFYRRTSGYSTWFTAGGAIRIALRQLWQNWKLRHLWRRNLGSRWKLQKTARDNFSIGAFYNITKNQDNPIKTVGRDSFLRSPSPYILGDTTRPRHITYVLVWSKSDQRRLRKTLHKQTDRQTDIQTDRHYENNGHLTVHQYWYVICIKHDFLEEIQYTWVRWPRLSGMPLSATQLSPAVKRFTMYFDCKWMPPRLHIFWWHLVRCWARCGRSGISNAQMHYVRYHLFTTPNSNNECGE